MTAADLRYPIGPFVLPSGAVTVEQREKWIGQIETLPRRLRHAVETFTAVQWDTPYRPGGWTVRQLMHHIPDSHLNAYTRFKLAVTEDEPTIKPYDEAAWAELPDTATTAPEVSLALLDALHRRWVTLLRAMTDRQYAKTLRHPEHGRTFRLDEMLAQYAWHSEHHLRHITTLVEREGWGRAEAVTGSAGFEGTRAHRYYAAECFNRAWELLEKPNRTTDDDEQMLRLSHASLWHWTQRDDCQTRNLSIGYWLISRIHVVLGHIEEARRYGHLCLDVSEKESPFLLGYAYEALARVEKTAGNDVVAVQYYVEARHLADAMTESDDRNLLTNDLKTLGFQEAV